MIIHSSNLLLEGIRMKFLLQNYRNLLLKTIKAFSSEVQQQQMQQFLDCKIPPFPDLEKHQAPSKTEIFFLGWLAASLFNKASLEEARQQFIHHITLLHSEQTPEDYTGFHRTILSRKTLQDHGVPPLT